MRLRTQRNAQIWHGLTFALAASALTLQLVLVLRGHQQLGESLPEIVTAGRPDLSTRLIRFGSYMTIWFTVMVAGTCAPLVVNPVHDGRIWRVMRLDAVVIAAIGGVVHWFLLRPLLDLSGADYLVDKLLHVAVPLMTLVGWVIFGPRGRAHRTDLLAFLVIPIAWLAYTLIRGYLVDWYPYPFMDVTLHGYVVVAANSLGLAVLLLGFAVGMIGFDRRLITNGAHPEQR